MQARDKRDHKGNGAHRKPTTRGAKDRGPKPSHRFERRTSTSVNLAEVARSSRNRAWRILGDQRLRSTIVPAVPKHCLDEWMYSLAARGGCRARRRRGLLDSRVNPAGVDAAVQRLGRLEVDVALPDQAA